MEINNKIIQQNNVSGLYFSWIPKTGKFIKLRFTDFQKLTGAIKYIGLSSPLTKFWIINLLVYSFVYPITRIVLGKKISCKICSYFVKTPSPPGIFSFPYLMKSRIALRKNVDWGVFIEVHISDAYYKDTLKEGMNVIDIGAHIGAYTILASEKVGNTGKVIAIEPEPQNYQRLLENVIINNFKNVVLKKTALSDHNGLERLYISPSSVRHSLLPQEGKITSIEVIVKTLDILLEELHIKKVDIIKIDVEGAEIEVIKGAKETLQNNPDAKIIVASYHYPGEVKEVQDFLHNMGFKTKVSPFDIVTTK